MYSFAITHEFSTPSYLEKVAATAGADLLAAPRAVIGFIDSLDGTALLSGVVLFKKSEWAEWKYVDNFPPAVARSIASASRPVNGQK
jgi:hypothetical protein